MPTRRKQLMDPYGGSIPLGLGNRYYAKRIHQQRTKSDFTHCRNKEIYKQNRGFVRGNNSEHGGES